MGGRGELQDILNVRNGDKAARVFSDAEIEGRSTLVSR